MEETAHNPLTSAWKTPKRLLSSTPKAILFFLLLHEFIYISGFFPNICHRFLFVSIEQSTTIRNTHPKFHVCPPKNNVFEPTKNENQQWPHLYWCYRRPRTVRIASLESSEIACPRCSGQFLFEIEMNRRRPVVDFTAYDPSPEARLIEALSLMLDPPIRKLSS